MLTCLWKTLNFYKHLNSYRRFHSFAASLDFSEVPTNHPLCGDLSATILGADEAHVSSAPGSQTAAAREGVCSSAAGLEAQRYIDYDFSPYISYGDGYRAASQITDSYTLTVTNTVN